MQCVMPCSIRVPDPVCALCDRVVGHERVPDGPGPVRHRHTLYGYLTPCVPSVTGWSAMNVYLTALALSDTAMLYTGTFPVWARKVFG